MDSPVHEALAYLYIAEGLSLPSTAGPWSRDELQKMLARLDTAKLDPSSQHTYEYVENILNASSPAFSMGLHLATELYLHRNTSSYTENEDWVYNYDARKAPLSVSMELSLADLFYAYTNIELKNAKYDEIDAPLIGTSPLYGRYAWTTNLFHFWRPEEVTLDSNVPYRSFGALGGNGWSFELGRDKLSWGPGKTGNFMLGDHLQYHNQGRFTAYGDAMKFTFVTSFFPHPDEIFVGGNYNQLNVLIGLKMFMGYRLEWRIPGNKVGLAISESIMYQSASGNLDLRILNPFMVYHNYYLLQNANSLISLELDYTPIPSLNLYTQIALDEMAVGAEITATEVHPNAMAWMLGATYSRPYQKGILHLSLEGVYTDPYLYLRSLEGEGEQTTDKKDSLNYIVAIRRWYGTLIYDQEFLGYRYGGDAIVGNLEVGYKEYGAWAIKGTLFYMAHGGMDMASLWKFDRPPLRTPSGSVTHYIDAGISGSTSFSEGWEAHAGLDLLARIADWTPTYDIQLYMGVGYTF